MNKKLLVYLCGLFLCACFFKCAQVVPPTGGPKDETPPKLLESFPKNFSTNCEENEFELVFDEYIQLDNINQKLLISPPLKYKPETTLKGKSLVLKLKDTLIENTTYTFNFSDAIKDNNEGNPIEGFEFVFSTGEKLDSLSVRGVVLDAFTLEPQKDILVMLYENLNDTVPFSELPFHLLKTGEDGQFIVNNVKNSEFKIFALGDENDNYLFDLPEEFIAFSNKNVSFESRTIEIVDSISLDSVITRSYNRMLADTFKLYLFQEDYEEQYLLGSERKIYRKLDFFFNRSLYHDSIMISPINFTPQKEWNLIETNQTMDTISYWITDTLISKMDTISLGVKYLVLDSLNEITWFSDTLIFDFKFKTEEEKQTKKKKRKKEKVSKKEYKKDEKSKNVRSRASRKSSEKLRTNGSETENIDSIEQKKKINYLKVKLNIRDKSTFDLGKSLTIESPTPISEFDPSKIKFFQIEDTLEFPKEIKIEKDSINNRRYLLSGNLEESSKYKLLIEPDAINDVYGLYNDTTKVNFATRGIESYGTIILNISGVNSDIILQLLDKSEKIINQKRIMKSGIVNFIHLRPKEYKLKVVYDRNNNFKWDTGYYIEKIQPERVVYYKEIINVRANWDIELNWNLEELSKNHNND